MTTGNDNRKAPRPGKATGVEDAMLRLEMVAAPLAFLLPPASPSPTLFSRIAVAAGIGTDPAGFYVCRSDDSEWKPAGEGIRVKVLSAKPTCGRLTLLMEMQPRAVMPAHTHGSDEECYVIEGSFEMGGTVYRTGDFLIASKGTAHPPVSSPTGCVVLLSMAAGY